MHIVVYYVERAAVAARLKGGGANAEREADSMSGSAQVRLPWRGLLTLHSPVRRLSVLSQSVSVSPQQEQDHVRF